jgi:DNA polymerase (family 10)
MPKKIFNFEIANILYEMSELYEMENVQFKPRAYRRAAESIEALNGNVSDIYNKGGIKALQEIPGVGEAIAEHIESLIKTGTFGEYEKFKKKIPVKWDELTAIQGIGPKTIKVLYKKLNIKNLKNLERAAKSGKIKKIKNFGEKTEENILRSIGFLRKGKGRFLLGNILPVVERVERALKKIPGVNQVVAAGSVRRMQETIGDIDILATAKKPRQVMEAFAALPEVETVFGKGDTKTNVRLKNGINADIRVLNPENYGSALQYFTGDKNHNIKLRIIAEKKGYKLNEYGLWKGKKMVAGKTEEEIYKKLGMDYIEPELRTDSGEIEASIAGKLPKLIPYNSVKGDLQVQTNWSDGTSSIKEMALMAKKMGLKYIAITDHTKNLGIAHGLDEKELTRQGKEIDRLNKEIKGIKILKSAEINILKNGKLDIADSALKKLDVVSVAVHSNFKMGKSEMTSRIIKAMQNPYVNILFHPTGRVIKQRPSYEMDMDEIIKAAKKYGVALEVDSFPDRLDLNDLNIRKAVEAGVKLVIDTDAHSPNHLSFLNFGVAQARRGWAKKSDILNTLPAEEFLKAIKGLKKN